ncbi:MAG: TldD/PmbA family protein, partial [Candidatus Eremiobacteraeota bacterium]|nr:TldD/PmbA family protein [Candidatus Eremiobacteraeota bacterium]
MQFESESQRALDTASSLGAQYADVRFGDSREEHIEVRNGVVSSMSDTDSAGFSVRVLVDGAWGFASSATVDEAELDRVAGLAVRIARASAKVKGQGISLLPVGSFSDTYSTPFEIDPASVSLNDRVSLLLAAEKELRATQGVTEARALMDIWRTKKIFASTDGSRIEQQLLQCGSAVHALAVGPDDVQDRMFPGTGGLYQTGGYEIINKAKLVENARRIGEEAVALLSAPQCPSGTMDLILSGDQVSLQIHESIGLALELDRVLGWEANFSGTSFATLDKLGSFRYGSEHVNVVCDMTCPLALATFKYDDEGTPAKSVYLIRDGVLV